MWTAVWTLAASGMAAQLLAAGAASRIGIGCTTDVKATMVAPPSVAAAGGAVTRGLRVTAGSVTAEPTTGVFSGLEAEPTLSSSRAVGQSRRWSTSGLHRFSEHGAHSRPLGAH